MPSFRYYHPIEVRYGDLDPQGHVNNARYLTYMEQARISYIQQLGLWQGDSFLDVGVILADAQVTFKESIHYGQPLRGCVRRTVPPPGSPAESAGRRTDGLLVREKWGGLRGLTP